MFGATWCGQQLWLSLPFYPSTPSRSPHSQGRIALATWCSRPPPAPKSSAAEGAAFWRAKCEILGVVAESAPNLGQQIQRNVPEPRRIPSV